MASSDAEKLLSQKLEDNTECGPDGKPLAQAGKPATHLGADMPPVVGTDPHTTGANKVRVHEKPHTKGQMKPSKGKKAAKAVAGAALLGGLVAGGVALYNNAKKGEGQDGNPDTLADSIAKALPHGKPISVFASERIAAKPSQVYAEWRQLENLPKIMGHLKNVRTFDDKRSFWEAKGPAGTWLSWNATITEDEPGRTLAWKSDENASVPNEGRITFKALDKGEATLLEVKLTYSPPAGEVGKQIAAAFGENPQKQVTDDVRKFKREVESRSTSAS